MSPRDIDPVHKSLLGHPMHGDFLGFRSAIIRLIRSVGLYEAVYVEHSLVTDYYLQRSVYLRTTSIEAPRAGTTCKPVSLRSS